MKVRPRTHSVDAEALDKVRAPMLALTNPGFSWDGEATQIRGKLVVYKKPLIEYIRLAPPGLSSHVGLRDAFNQFHMKYAIVGPCPQHALLKTAIATTTNWRTITKDIY